MPLRSCRELSLQVVDPVSDMPPSELLPTVERIPYQNMTITYQELIDAIENLPIEEQESLFELIHKRRIEKRRVKIATNAGITFDAIGRVYLVVPETILNKDTRFDIKKITQLLSLSLTDRSFTIDNRRHQPTRIAQNSD